MHADPRAKVAEYSREAIAPKFHGYVIPFSSIILCNVYLHMILYLAPIWRLGAVLNQLLVCW